MFRKKKEISLDQVEGSYLIIVIILMIFFFVVFLAEINGIDDRIAAPFIDKPDIRVMEEQVDVIEPRQRKDVPLDHKGFTDYELSSHVWGRDYVSRERLRAENTEINNAYDVLRNVQGVKGQKLWRESRLRLCD